MNIFAVIIWVYVAVSAAIFSIQPFGASSDLVNKVVSTSHSVIAFAAGLYAISQFGVKGRRSKSLICLTSGTGAWFLGDLFWNVEQFRIGSVSFPSFGDYFYLLGYLFLLAGVILEVSHANIQWHPSDRKFLNITRALSIVIMLLFAYVSIYLTFDPQVTAWENIVTIGYGVGDILLINCTFLLLVLLREYQGGSITDSWWYLMAGFVLTLAADLLYGIFTADYESGKGLIYALTDLLYVGGYACIALSFQTFAQAIRRIRMRAVPAVK